MSKQYFQRGKNSIFIKLECNVILEPFIRVIINSKNGGKQQIQTTVRINKALSLRRHKQGLQLGPITKVSGDRFLTN